MGDRRWSFGWIKIEGIEGCIELSAHIVKAFVAEIERAISVECEWRSRIGRHTSGGNERGNAGFRVDGVEVVAKIGQVEFSADFPKIESVKAQWLTLEGDLSNHGFHAVYGIDFGQTAGIAAGRYQREQSPIVPPY